MLKVENVSNHFQKLKSSAAAGCYRNFVLLLSFFIKLCIALIDSPQSHFWIIKNENLANCICLQLWRLACKTIGYGAHWMKIRPLFCGLYMLASASALLALRWPCASPVLALC
jgi:hypothetical protein